MPDFQEHYNLRLIEVVRDFEPCEVVLLIAGLPGTSRYAARLGGEQYGSGWDTGHWLALDTRNAIEGLRATIANMATGKNKAKFREWTAYPGYDREQEKKAAQRLDRWRGMATDVTE